MNNSKNATITLWGRYKYRVLLDSNMSMHDVAMEIALAVHKAEGKTKFTRVPRTYNYVFECLQRQTVHNFRMNASDSQDNRKEIYAAASKLHSSSVPVKSKCLDCSGSGCKKCNGHGYIIMRNNYRVGVTFNHTLVIDIDSHDLQNLLVVVQFYEKILKVKFRIFKTNKGFWLFADKKYQSTDDFKFAHCQVLNPYLSRNEYRVFVRELLALDTKDDVGIFKGATALEIKESKFYRGHGNFDVAFTFLSIKRERSTIRESAKKHGDKIEEVVF